MRIKEYGNIHCFSAICPRCRALFDYELADIRINFEYGNNIKCPVCGKIILQSSTLKLPDTYDQWLEMENKES